MSGAGGIPSWAVRGAKVVLVDDSPGRLDNGWQHGKRSGEIFTLSEILSEHGRVGCRVREWSYSLFEYTDIRRFRPLVDDHAQERDVALFRKHLTQKVGEDA